MTPLQQSTFLWIAIGIIFIIILTRQQTENFNDDSNKLFAIELAKFMQPTKQNILQYILGINMKPTKPTFSEYLLHLIHIKNTHNSLVNENVYNSLVSLEKITGDDVLQYIK
jgi:hypothetical protein